MFHISKPPIVSHSGISEMSKLLPGKRCLSFYQTIRNKVLVTWILHIAVSEILCSIATREIILHN